MNQTKYFLGIFILIISNCCYSQTISKLLQNNYCIRDTTIKEIIESKTYIEASGITTYKKTYYYNNKGLLTKQVGLDTEGKLSSILELVYDENDNLISLKDEKWNHSIGYSVNTTRFIFDSLKLKVIQSLNTEGKIQSSSVVRNEKGFPISLHSYNANNLLIGYEIAKYNFENDEVIISVYDEYGNQIGNQIELHVNLSNKSEFRINGKEYNDFGEITSEMKRKCYSCDDFVNYKYEYKYDKFNNWIKKSTFLIDKSKTKKTTITKRKIEYRNTQPNNAS